MPPNSRQQRILRAEELATESSASAEILHFLVHVMRFQDELQSFLETVLSNGSRKVSFLDPIISELGTRFPRFLTVIEKRGPPALAKESERLGKLSDSAYGELLSAFWTRAGTSSAVGGEQEFFARAFLQPYAELVRRRAGKQQSEWTPRNCPFCLRRPGSGVLRPLGEGGQRFLLCSFCLGEWEFRRIVCPACGEENESKLPVYTAEQFNHVRVECCDSCRTYIKTVDLTRNGLADPLVDEIAAVPLDLWAEDGGYSKLQSNLLLL